MAVDRYGCPTVGYRVVTSPVIEVSEFITWRPVNFDSAPNDHFVARPDCGVGEAGRGCAVCADRCPIVRGRIVASANRQITEALVVSAPDDHLTARPDRRMPVRSEWRAIGVHCGPTVFNGIVKSAISKRSGPKALVSSPNNHLVARPHCTVPHTPD